MSQVKGSPRFNLNIDQGQFSYVSRDSMMTGSPERLNQSFNGNSPRDPVVPQTPVGLIKVGLPDILSKRRNRNRLTFASMYADP
jgi:hypothetical protein